MPFEKEIKSLGRAVISLELDVRDQQSFERMVEAAESAFGHLEILVNNAGCNCASRAGRHLGRLESDPRYQFGGSFFVAQAVARRMIPRRYGRIINIGSVTSVAGYAGLVLTGRAAEAFDN